MFSLGISLRVKGISAPGCCQHPLAPVQSQEDNPISPVLCGCSPLACSPTFQLSNYPIVTPLSPLISASPTSVSCPQYTRPPQCPILRLSFPHAPSHPLLTNPSLPTSQLPPPGRLWPWLSHSVLSLSPTLLPVPRFLPQVQPC